MKKDWSSGFTLVEIAIVLVLIGLIAGLIMPALFKSIKRTKVKEAQESLEKLKDEIIGFAIAHNRLPNNSTEYDGLSNRIDPWKKKILYWVDDNLDVADGICNANGTVLEVDNKQTGTVSKDVAFIIVSKGQNTHQETVNNNGTVTYYKYGVNIGGYKNDDLIEYVPLAYLKSKICSAATASNSGPKGSDISFAANMDEFDQKSAVTPVSGKPTVIVDQDAKTITLGNGYHGPDAYGCYWYEGDSEPCNAGNCTFGNGVRVFFRFKFPNPDNPFNDSTKYGYGFTFAIISAFNNNFSVCGQNKGYLGYAGNNFVTDPIRYPKLAVEIDTYPNNPFFDLRPYNHVSFMYWGKNSTVNDDLQHGVGDTGAPTNCKNPDGYYYNATNVIWLEDGQTHTFRLEIDRNQTTGKIQLKTWIDCENCDDLSVPYTATPPTIQHNASDVAIPEMDNIIFGWTEGAGLKSQTVIISDFGINFLP